MSRPASGFGVRRAGDAPDRREWPVPRYDFDIDDGDRHDRDEEGLDLPDALAARREAIATLPDMACDKLPDGDRRRFLVSVRDASGTVLDTATLDLVGEWRITPPTSMSE